MASCVAPVLDDLAFGSVQIAPCHRLGLDGHNVRVVAREGVPVLRGPGWAHGMGRRGDMNCRRPGLYLESFGVASRRRSNSSGDVGPVLELTPCVGQRTRLCGSVLRELGEIEDALVHDDVLPGGLVCVPGAVMTSSRLNGVWLARRRHARRTGSESPRAARQQPGLPRVVEA